MAPKKDATASAATPPLPSKESNPDGFTQERFERELMGLAAKAQGQDWKQRAMRQGMLIIKSATVLVLAGIYCNASQLALSPVYGSIPASTNNPAIVILGAFIGWSCNLFLSRNLPVDPAQLLPVIALCTPAIQFYMYKLSSYMGAFYGPLAIEAATLFPLLVVSAACAATWLDDVDLSFLPGLLAESIPGLVSWSVLKVSQNTSSEHLQANIGKSLIYTRVGLELLLALPYTVLAPSKLLLLTVPALLHTALFNYHIATPMATAALNSTLLADQYMLLDRQESVTGYISVIESLTQGYRVLRCDHSLLGGDWVKHRTAVMSEPIYAVFVMLEAVRLIKTPEPVPDNEASALVIGLGIGTTPSALIGHGIDTTVVEIDPVVHDFAMKYFVLPSNHTAVLEDAVSYTAQLADNPDGKRFDYIVHDVFTGGAEPVELFTLEFLQGLNSLLKPSGVIAINYAGDFAHPSPKIIVQTIREVFPSCRVFRESPRDEEEYARDNRDFTNMVIFCKKTSGPLQFRSSKRSDYLGSQQRKMYMEPQFEVLDSDFLEEHKGGILRRNKTDLVNSWHQRSAAGHWNVMRTVMPAQVWERW